VCVVETFWDIPGAVCTVNSTQWRWVRWMRSAFAVVVVRVRTSRQQTEDQIDHRGEGGIPWKREEKGRGPGSGHHPAIDLGTD
jgi:hypothetical protein